MRMKILQRKALSFLKKLADYRDQTILKLMNEKLSRLWEMYKQVGVSILVDCGHEAEFMPILEGWVLFLIKAVVKLDFYPQAWFESHTRC